MKATKEQIIAEANRRAVAQGYGAPPVEHFIVDVVCENWTPPEPVVDPDELAFDGWWAIERHNPSRIASTSSARAAYLAGARMARKQVFDAFMGPSDV